MAEVAEEALIVFTVAVEAFIVFTVAVEALIVFTVAVEALIIFTVAVEAFKDDTVATDEFRTETLVGPIVMDPPDKLAPIVISESSKSELRFNTFILEAFKLA